MAHQEAAAGIALNKTCFNVRLERNWSKERNMCVRANRPLQPTSGGKIGVE